MGPLARYGNNQETVSRIPEQIYTSSDIRLELLRDGPLFEWDSNKCQGAKMSPLFESPPRLRPAALVLPVIQLFFKKPQRSITSKIVVVISMKVLNFGSNILARKFPVSSLFFETSLYSCSAHVPIFPCLSAPRKHTKHCFDFREIVGDA